MHTKIAFLGLGNIGSGVFKLLDRNRFSIKHKVDVEFHIKYALVKDVNKKRDLELNDTILTDNIDDILNDDEVTIVAEFLGGISPATSYMERCLKAGKSVVTANKEALANSWHILESVAKEHNVGLYYEACVGGGIPIISTVKNSLQANNVSIVMGIINGTTNYILTKMSDEGKDYLEVLKAAQSKGLAEPDPTSDVEGTDAASKLCILASLAFHTKIPLSFIHCEGISRVSAIDIEYGKELGYTLKLLAIAKKDGMKVEARVHPTFIKHEHPLAGVKGSYNAIFIHGDAVGDLMLYGRGAGDMPTASAIISDMVIAATTKTHVHTTFNNSELGSSTLEFDDNWLTRFYIRIDVSDKSGVLAAMTSILAKHEVSIESLVQKSYNTQIVPVVFVTHLTQERAMMRALMEIEELDSVFGVKGLIRVEAD